MSTGGERTSRRPAAAQDENSLSTRLTRAKAAAAGHTANAVAEKQPIGLRKRPALGELNKNVNKPATRLSKPADTKPANKNLNITLKSIPSNNKTLVIPERISSRRAVSNIASAVSSSSLSSSGASQSLDSRPALRDLTKRHHSIQGGRVSSKRPKVLDERDSVENDKENATRPTDVVVEQLPENPPSQSALHETSLTHNTHSHDNRQDHLFTANLKGIDYSWDDLDADETDDPLMVSEYVEDIFDYLWKSEPKYVPNPSYPQDVQERQGVTWRSRGILIDWLVEVHVKFRLLPETLFLAVNIVDRYFSQVKTGLSKIQLVGVASLFIASKYEEVYCPSIHALSFIAEGSTDDEILEMEKNILRVLGFDLGYPNPMNFLRRISKADDYDMETRTIGKYLLEVSLMDHRLLGFPPSILSAASMFFARMILGRPEWNGNLMHYSGYPEHDLYPVINIMVDYIGSRVIHEAFFKKYASRKFLKASILCRAWVREMLSDHTKFTSVYRGYAVVEDALTG